MNPYVIISLATGLIMMGAGLWSWKRPRHKINPLMGYRTARSMKSQAAWDFAQVHSGKAFFCAGCMLILVSIPLAFAVFTWMSIVVFVFMAIATFAPLYFTEKELKQRFDKEGNPVK